MVQLDVNLNTETNVGGIRTGAFQPLIITSTIRWIMVAGIIHTIYCIMELTVVLW